MLSESLVPFRFVNESNVHVPQNTNDSRKEISYTTISCVFFLFVLYAARMLMVMLWHFFGVYSVTKLLGNAELFYGVQSCNSQEGVAMLCPFNFSEAYRLLKFVLDPTHSYRILVIFIIFFFYPPIRAQNGDIAATFEPLYLDK